MVAAFIALCILAYLLGSIPTAYLIFKKLTGEDIRKHGSLNAGATNLRRCLKDSGIASYNKWFVLTLIVDGAKAALPLSITCLCWGYNSWMVGPISLIAVIGHIFPAFIPKPRFRGGKGAATAIFGVFLPLIIFYVIDHQQLSVVALAVSVPLFWAFVYFVTGKLMSAANVLLLIYIATIFFGSGTVLTNDFSIIMLWIFVGYIAVIISFAHHDNLQRIIKGAEPGA